MSKWTHVLGTVKIRNLSLLGLEAVTEEQLGKIIEYDYAGAWNTIIPLGSEGSLRWHRNTYGECGDTFDVITVEGDLRDYGEEESDVEEILTYMNNICRDKFCQIANLTIHVEFNYIRHYIYDSDKKEFVLLYEQPDEC